MFQQLRERLTLLLILALPFHAFAVTVATRILKGPGHAPLAILAVWKEALLVVILAIICIEIVRKCFGQERSCPTHLDALDILIIALILLGLAISLFSYPLSAIRSSLFTVALGFKYDFLPLLAFLLARRVPWSQWLKANIEKWLLIIGVAIAAFGILSFVLPSSIFVVLGYSPIYSLYFTDGPLAAFQMIGDTKLHRIQSVMSGPNQLGLWLILPLCIALSQWVKKLWDPKIVLSLLILGIALILTFSRTAWIAAFVGTLVAFTISLPPRLRREAIITVLASAAIVGILAIFLFPDVLFRLGSSRGHFERPIEGIQQMIAHPFGQGLGSAGPASHRGRDTCIMLRQGDDPSWAKNLPKLCVFVGGAQVQPKDRVCLCPFLTENWYVQVGVETGFIGFALFLALTILLIRKLWQQSFIQMDETKRKWKLVSQLIANRYPLLAFAALSVAALFLHAWEDAAIAYALWILAGISLSHD
ncbi:MAG: O-antigen ligase family protein [Candidatus Peregrinibacteria bacterium]